MSKTYRKLTLNGYEVIVVHPAECEIATLASQIGDKLLIDSVAVLRFVDLYEGFTVKGIIDEGFQRTFDPGHNFVNIQDEQGNFNIGWFD